MLARSMRARAVSRPQDAAASRPGTARLDDLVADPAGFDEDLGARDPHADVALGVGTSQLDAGGLVEARQRALEVAR